MCKADDMSTEVDPSGLFNPRLTKLFFVTRATPSLDFPNRTPYEIGFGINR